MKVSEAIEVCQSWIAFNRTQRDKSVELQRLAALARTSPEGAKEARRKMAQIDRQPQVFSGERLEPAVRCLIDAARATVHPAEGQT